MPGEKASSERGGLGSFSFIYVLEKSKIKRKIIKYYHVCFYHDYYAVNQIIFPDNFFSYQTLFILDQ